MSQARKTQKIEVRLTEAEKNMLKRMCKIQNKEVSELVKEKLFLRSNQEFCELVEDIEATKQDPFAFARLSEFLKVLTPENFLKAVEYFPSHIQSPFCKAYVASMVEFTAHVLGVLPPLWVKETVALEEPYFGSTLKNMRAYLMTQSPIPFRQRNIFIESADAQ